MCTHHRDRFWFAFLTLPFYIEVAGIDGRVHSGEHNTMHSRQLEPVLEKIKKIKVPRDAEIHFEIVFSRAATSDYFDCRLIYRLT